MMTHFYFAPIAVVTLGSWGSEAKSLVAEIGRHITLKCGDSHSGSFLMQRMAVAI